MYNLKSILQKGLLSPNEQRRLGINHHSIAEEGIQRRRADMDVTCGPQGKVHDYVPFYFCERSSMLQAVIRKKNIDQQFIIYFAVPITIMETHPCVFTNASANTEPPPDFFEDLQQIPALNWKLIDTRKWKLSDDEKKIRMAELLVHTKLDPKDFSKIIVWNDSFKEFVEKIYKECGLTPPPIYEDPRFFYNKYPDAPNDSLITGPFFTQRAFKESVEYILKTGQNANARYRNIRELLQELQTRGLEVLPETAELIGLKTDNPMHEEDAGTHTLSVVRELLASAEFQSLEEKDQRLVELAAYLHDIGKGPKSRWVNNGGKQKVDPDHPIGSVEMLKRILTQEIREITPRSVRVLCKLVCYHDLIGDIVGNGRDIEQLEKIAEKPKHLDMLIALSLADVKAIEEIWYVQCEARIPALRKQVLGKLNVAETEED